MRHERLSVLCLAIIAATTTLGAVGPAELASTEPHRDPSGLLIVAASDFAMPDDLRDAFGLAEMLSAENPDDFGVTTVTNGTVTLPSTSARSGALTAKPAGARVDALGAYLADAAASPTLVGVSKDKLLATRMSSADRSVLANSVTVTSGGPSRAETYATSDAVFDLQFDPKYRDAGIWQTEVDPETGHVVVSVEKLTRPLADAIVASYGTEAVNVRVAPAPESYPASRPHDTNPYYGGALIGQPTGTCTSGFAWVSGSTSMMLSAGHCFKTGGNATVDGTTIGYVTSASRENWQSGTGTVYLSGQSTYRGDISLITMSGGATSTARIYSGSSTSSTSRSVAVMWSRSPVNGDLFCTGGAYSGEVCGWRVQSVGVNHTYSTGEVVRHATQTYYREGWCVRPGDSGGPTYTVRADNAVAAKGIISGAGGGGSDYYGGATDPCIMWFTDIYDPYYAFPGTLKTS